MKVVLKNHHTVAMFIGISGSGKSVKARQLDELAKGKGLKSVIMSSDDCRHELLLSDDYHHYDAEMIQVSDKAFELLMHKTELYLQWPHNANLVIMDMMNLRKEDRQKIISIAGKYCYDIIGIVLDYPNIEDYFLGLDEKYDKKLISYQLKKFRTITLTELGKKLYNDLVRIKSKIEPIELECAFNIKMEDVNLPNDKHDFIVSDIHECIESFKALLKKVGFEIEKVNGKEEDKEIVKEKEIITGRDDTRIIIDGDFLDKGNKTRETIEFLYSNMDKILFVWGGHESFVYKWLNGNMEQRNVDKTFYTSIPILEQDEELKKKFFAICDRMKPYYQGKHFVVTHAGCRSEFIGKTQAFATKTQRYYKVERLDDSVDDETWLEGRRKELNYLKEDAEGCHPLHVFGHEQWKNHFVYKNKINIDTGCVSGGKLTGVEISAYNGEYKIWHVACIDEVSTKEKLREFRFEEPKIELEDRDYNRLLRFAGNRVNFISGTMCPADKNGDELEDLDRTLDYFKNKGVDKVMLQIKYMGSRCNIYLFDNIEKSYAVSRNGFIIRKLDLTKIYKGLKERLSEYFEANDLEMMIIDGELMPWSAMGEDLIDSTFQAINKGIRSELDLLKNNGFEDQLKKLNEQYRGTQFDSDRHTMKKEELYTKYGPQKYEAYKLLSDFYMPDLDELERLHSLYNKQLDIYAKRLTEEELISELHYQPFSILKSVKKNGEEIYYFGNSNETVFKAVNDAEYKICELTPDGYKEARSFFDRVTIGLNFEGVVVKPYSIDTEDCAPFMKVRSPNYLTIIYGYDYLNDVKYGRLLDQKRIRRKLRTSVAEWQLGKKLLQIPYKDISENNPRYMDLMEKMIVETNGEESIDPRL
jgi:predicted kinase